VMLTLTDELDIVRGDMLVAAGSPPRVATTFAATLCWLGEEPPHANARYVLKHTTRKVKAKIFAVTHHLDIHTLQRHVPQRLLQMNDIASVTMQTQQPLFVDAYTAMRATGAFVLIDEATHQTVAAGMVE
jgi:sulfate adenylyltransferase subunit 1